MNVIHFTHGATDPLTSFDATGARFLPLADGSGDTHISCLHLEQGGKISASSVSHAAAQPMLRASPGVTFLVTRRTRVRPLGAAGKADIRSIHSAALVPAAGE